MEKQKLNAGWALAGGSFPIAGDENNPLTDQAKKLSNLGQFTGTSTYYQVALMNRTVCTDGAKFVADTAGAWWMLDAILSWQIKPKVKKETFQVWKLTVWEDHSATLECQDGNGNLIISQEIPFTDFPVPEMTLWYIWENGGLPTILLPSEY